MRNALMAATFLALTASLTTQAAEHWIHLTTPHFEMYTTNSVKQATAALNDFEQVRYFFLENSRSKTAPDATVRIIAFRSEKEFKPYRMNEGAFAYYLRSRKGRLHRDAGPQLRPSPGGPSRVHASSCGTPQIETSRLAQRRDGGSLFFSRAGRR
jgi:hypothetical protein